MKNYIIFASIGFELVGLIVGSYFFGEALDKKYQTGGMAFVVLSLACLVGWLTRVVWLLQRMQKNEEKERLNSERPK